jgi:hypothetical protein
MMNPGKERILKLLQESEDFISIEKLADMTGTGSRSVFRYISELRYSLSRYNLHIETKYGKGIRLSGAPENLKKLSSPNEGSGFSGFSMRQRQFAEIALLCTTAEDTVKLGSLAHIFGVSDSCISLDLSGLENDILKRPELCHLRLCRKPGAGTGIEGPLWYRRMALLYCSINVFPVDVPEKNSSADKGNRPKLEHLKSVLGLQVPHDTVRACIETAENLLAYSLFPSDYMLLYLYVCCVASSPVKSSAQEQDGRHAAEQAGIPHALDPPVTYAAAAGVLEPVRLNDNPEEIFMLRCLLSSLAPARLKGEVQLLKEIPQLVSAVEKDLAGTAVLPEAFGNERKAFFGAALQSVIYRKAYGIPLEQRNGTGISGTEKRIAGVLWPQIQTLYHIEPGLQDTGLLQILVRSLSAGQEQAADAGDKYPGIQNSTYRSIHRIFSMFRITETARPVKKRKITAELAKLIGKNKTEWHRLKQAFDVREKKGHVYLEVANIRLFHCRSDVLDCAQAGLIRSRKPPSVILYLAAPENATKEELYALSLISSALIESDEFSEALKEKTARQIEELLLRLMA